jgi:hypothetical protein
VGWPFFLPGLLVGTSQGYNAHMAQPNQALEAVAQPPDKDDAYERLAKSIMRKRATDQMVTAIKRDIALLSKTSDMARRSVKVLDYMRGYVKAVDEELAAAQDEYESAIYAARVQHDQVFKKERKSSLARIRRNPHPAEPTQ